jgi:transposase
MISTRTEFSAGTPARHRVDRSPWLEPSPHIAAKCTSLRRFQRRWIEERRFAWLGNFRRFVAPNDRSLTIFQAFLQIACFVIVLRRVLK